jgi:hypothetical protein
VNAYRAELHDMIMTLFVFECMCDLFQITLGGAKIYCDNKKGVEKAAILQTKVTQANHNQIQMHVWTLGQWESEERPGPSTTMPTDICIIPELQNGHFH